jgi:hypothetical protein
MQVKKETLSQVAKLAMGWYEGRIIFTNNKGLVGVGLPRKRSRTTPKTRITTPDGTTIAMTVTDDTQPGGPRQVTRTFTAPFARVNREEDYRTAWAFFEKNTKGIE